MALTAVSWQVISTPTATAADLADKAASVNTTGKYEGLMVWDADNKRLMRASGATDTDPWDCVDGLTSVTPS